MAYDIDSYRAHLERYGRTRRDRNISVIRREFEYFAPDNPAYKSVTVNGIPRNVIVNSQDDYTIKEIVSMPDERVPFGAMVSFNGRPWIVTTTDVDDEIYSKSKMYLCACILKWKDSGGNVHSYDAYVEDATKYSEGVEYSDRMQIGEFQLKAKITVDKISSTIKRDMRFIIDSQAYLPNLISNGERPYVFRVTRRNIVTGTYEDEGYVEITLVQDQWIEGKDDAENMIAYQPDNRTDIYPNEETTSESGWI